MAALPVLAGLAGYAPAPEAQSANRPLPRDTVHVVVEGEVVDDDTGRPIEGARVRLHARPPGTWSGDVQITGSNGGFRFSAVPVGTHLVMVTVADYDAMSDSLPVHEGLRHTFILPLSKGRGSLPPRAVSDDPAHEGPRDYRGRRLRGGAGFLVTRQDVRERQPRFVSELLSRVPGGMLVPSETGGYTLLLRGQCRPGVWVDGVRLGVTNVDNLVSPQELEALEVYHAHELPVEFGVDFCGGILLWTRRGVESARAPDDDETDDATLGDQVLGYAFRVAVLGVVILLISR